MSESIKRLEDAIQQYVDARVCRLPALSEARKAKLNAALEAVRQELAVLNAVVETQATHYATFQMFPAAVEKPELVPEVVSAWKNTAEFNLQSVVKL